MNPSSHHRQCIHCLASFQLSLDTQGVDLALLQEFFRDSVAHATEHYTLVQSTLTSQQRIAYLAKRHNADLFLTLLSRGITYRSRQPLNSQH